MADYITSIRTTEGDMQYDYDSLANKPESDPKLETSGAFADAQVVGNKLKTINTQISNINGQITEIKNNAQSISANNITSGTLSADRLSVIPIEKGGTEATNGQDGLRNLLAAGAMILSSNQYGDTLPSNPEQGQVFFVKIE